jgi:hypothetical protein
MLVYLNTLLKYDFIAEENVGREIGLLFYPVEPGLWDTIY